MRPNLSALVNKAIFSILVTVGVLVPLTFTSVTTEFFETPKLVILAVAVTILMILWGFSWVLEGKIVVTRTPLDLPLLLLLVTVLVSTFLSDSKYIAIFGNFPRVHGSAISWVLYILLYFIAVSNIKGILQARIIIMSLLGSAVVCCIISIMSYAGVYLPLTFAKNMAFSPAGTSFSAAALSLLLFPIVYIHLLKPSKILSLPIALLVSIIFGLTIILIGSFTSQIILALSVIAIFLISDKRDLKSNAPFLIAPIVVCALILGLSFIPLAKKNPLLQKRVAFNKDFTELQLPPQDSWKVAISSFRDNPAFGSGPSTFLFNFTQFKPATINLTTLWNFRFDTAYNEFFQILATLGALGFLAFLFFALSLVKISLKVLRHADAFTVGLAVSVLMFVALLLFHVSTPVSMVIGLLIIVSLIAIKKSEGKVEEFTLGVKASSIRQASGINGDFGSSIQGDILPIIVFIPIVVLSLVGLWQTYQIVSADVYHRLGLNAISQRGLQSYDYLRQAENLNPVIDLYRTDMAQTNFLIANAIATAKAPNESSPGGSLTDADKTNIQQFLSQSINEARAAVAISPRSAQNWEILASIYRQITGVAENALQFSIDGYGRAIALDPYNPLLRLNVGGLYYSLRNYDMAIRFFDDAVNLKPDYANAYYNLSIALRDKGNLQEALTIGERTVQILQKDTSNPDYQVAADYLKDLKARIATGSAQNSEISAPAAAQNGALQNQNLPDVPLEQLDEQPSVATPPAVKK